MQVATQCVARFNWSNVQVAVIEDWLYLRDFTNIIALLIKLILIVLCGYSYGLDHIAYNKTKRAKKEEKIL